MDTFSSVKSRQEVTYTESPCCSTSTRSSLRPALVAPSLNDVLHKPVQVLDDLCLVEEGLCHPEKPQVFLRASIQYLTQKLQLRLIQLHNQQKQRRQHEFGHNPMTTSTCIFCCNRNEVSFTSCDKPPIPAHPSLYTGMKVVEPTRSQPNMSDNRETVNYKTVFSTSMINRKDSLNQNVNFVSFEDSVEMMSDSVILDDYLNFDGMPEWRNMKLTESAPSRSVFSFANFSTPLPPPQCQTKSNPPNVIKSKMCLKLSKKSKHYTRLQSAILHLIGSKIRLNISTNKDNELDEEYPEDRHSSKDIDKSHLSSEIVMKQKEHSHSLMSNSMVELADNNVEMKASPSRQCISANNSPRTISKFSQIFAYIFNKHEKYSRRLVPELTQKLEDIQKDPKRVLEENVSRNQEAFMFHQGLDPLNTQEYSNSNIDTEHVPADLFQGNILCPSEIIPSPQVFDLQRCTVESVNKARESSVECLHPLTKVTVPSRTCVSPYKQEPVENKNLWEKGQSKQELFEKKCNFPNNIMNQRQRLKISSNQSIGKDVHTNKVNDRTQTQDKYSGEVIPRFKTTHPNFVDFRGDTRTENTQHVTTSNSGYIKNKPTQNVSNIPSMQHDNTSIPQRKNSVQHSNMCGLQTKDTKISEITRQEIWTGMQHNLQTPIVFQVHTPNSSINIQSAVVNNIQRNVSPTETWTALNNPPSKKLQLSTTQKENDVTYLARTVSHTIETTSAVRDDQENRTETWDEAGSVTTLYVSKLNKRSETSSTYMRSALDRIVTHLARSNNKSEVDVINIISTQPMGQTNPTSGETDRRSEGKNEPKKIPDVTPNAHKGIVESSIGLSNQHESSLQQYSNSTCSRRNNFVFRQSSICPSFKSHNSVSRQSSKLSVYESSESNSSYSEESVTDLDYSPIPSQTNMSMFDRRSTGRNFHPTNTNLFGTDSGSTPQVMDMLKACMSTEEIFHCQGSWMESA